MTKRSLATGIEINPKLVGGLFTDRIGDSLRVFCYYTNGETSQFDVPEEDNRESLLGLLATLNVEATRTSFILDELVQGRVFVQSGTRHSVYTLLRCPGRIPPPMNADIADLPWQVCWRSYEVEVLRYAQSEGLERCMAIRTHISEDEASRMVRDSKAFVRPVSVPRKQPPRWLHASIGIALLTLAFLVAAKLCYPVKQNRETVAQPKLIVQAKAVSDGGDYYLLCNHKISGPFPAKVIADMSAGGLFSEDTMCRPDNSTEWGRVAVAFPRVAQN